MHPMLIRIGAWGLPTYGALIAAAYMSAIFWLKKKRQAMGLGEDEFWFLIYSIFFGAIAGGKLLYVIVEFRSFLSGELGFFRDFRYGFVFFGGFFGAFFMALWAQRRLKFDRAKVFDYCAAALPLGHAIGRLGCLASGCCYGKPTLLPWGVVLGGDPASTTPRELWGTPLHPTQLYESLANLAIFAFLARWAISRAEAGLIKRGSVVILYIILYSALRFTIEFWRGDDRGGWAGLSTSQWFGLFAGAVGLAALARRGFWLRPA